MDLQFVWTVGQLPMPMVALAGLAYLPLLPKVLCFKVFAVTVDSRLSEEVS